MTNPLAHHGNISKRKGVCQPRPCYKRRPFVLDPHHRSSRRYPQSYCQASQVGSQQLVLLRKLRSFLDLGDQFKLLSTHPIFLALANNHLSPIPSSIRRLLERGPPYPKLLAKLPLLSLFVPEGDGTFFMDILVQARPRWILERLEYGRWSDSVWRAAFEKRFLPSWKRYKGEDDSWRAIFLR